MTEPPLFGEDLFGDPVVQRSRGPVADRFTFPPFSILDARGGDWQERKRAWTAMGLKSEVGRAENLLKYSDTVRIGSGTSIFDPVLCELLIRWFSPEGGQVVDPFAGGSVRGVVAVSLGRKYWGCDLRQEQISANEEQAVEIFGAGDAPVWVCGDSAITLDGSPASDMILSCPPYGDLEQYSDDPSDLSAMPEGDFKNAYRVIISKAVARMRPDSFACWVVGDYRGKDGLYRNFVSSTIRAFEDAGARLYNEAILATPTGSAAMRVGKQFSSGRKFVKIHQNVLVFCKGEWRAAAAKCNPPEEDDCPSDD